jgi:hypothetical protein
MAVGELAAFVLALSLATWAWERPLLSELAGYLRSRSGGTPIAAG